MSNENKKNKSISPSRPRQKTLKLNDLDKKAKKLNQLTTYTIDRKTNEVVKYNEIFDEKKIQELIIELNEHMQYDKKNKIGYFENNQKVIEYIYFLIIKHFSHFKNEIGSQFETNIASFDKLVSLGLFHKFHNDIFDPEQVAKVFDRFYERIEIVSDVIKLDDETKEKLANLQNKDLIFKKNKIIPEA